MFGRWDPYPFILLNLAFSTQAAYAAPLIPCWRRTARRTGDRCRWRRTASAAQTKSDTEFLARELAALRLAVGEVATRDYLRRELRGAARAVSTALPVGPAPAVKKWRKKAGRTASRGAAFRPACRRYRRIPITTSRPTVVARRQSTAVDVAARGVANRGAGRNVTIAVTGVT